MACFYTEDDKKGESFWAARSEKYPVLFKGVNPGQRGWSYVFPVKIFNFIINTQ
jgi:hypothetical protein